MAAKLAQGLAVFQKWLCHPWLADTVSPGGIDPLLYWLYRQVLHSMGPVSGRPAICSQTLGNKYLSSQFHGFI